MGKLCPDCNEVKVTSEFYKHKLTKDGFNTYCKACHKIRGRKYYDKNKQTVITKAKKYNASDAGKIWRADYNKKNKETIAAYKKKWQSSEDGLAYQRDYQKIRRHNEHGCITVDEWKRILENYEYSCSYCGEERALEMDHVIPVSKGGITEVDNIVPACRSCNARKSNKDLEVWLGEVQKADCP